MVIQTGDLRIGVSQAAHTSRVDRQEAERSSHLGRLIVEDSALEVVVKLLNAGILGLAVAEDLGVAFTQLGNGLLKVHDSDAMLADTIVEGFLQGEDLTVLPLHGLSQITNLTLEISNGGALLVVGLSTDRLASEQGIVLVEGVHILLAPVFSFRTDGCCLSIGLDFGFVLGLGLGDKHLGAGHNVMEGRNQFGNGLIEFGHINFLL